MGARKWGGEYGIPLLALEVSSANGEMYRIYLEGEAKDYEASGVLASLREPLSASVDVEMRKAKAASDAHDAEIAAVEATRRRETTAPKPLDQGGGMYTHEKAFDYAASALHFVRTRVLTPRAQKSSTP
jgi:hypothetical protein